MLQKIRDIATGWLAVVIVVLLIIPFAFWGINYYFGQGTEPIVASINDTEIKINQFQRALYNLRQQMQDTLGQTSGIDDDLLKQETLSRLIDSEVINQASLEAGLRVSDDKVFETINAIKVFQSEYGFDSSLYQRAVVSMGMDPTVFEQQVRMDMLSEQLQSAISESSFSIHSELEQLARLRNQTRDFDYVLLKINDFRNKVEVSEPEIEEYYQTHMNEFVRPEQVKVQYVNLTLDKVAEQVQVEAGDIDAYFATNQLNYTDPEKRKVWQIKIKKDKDLSDEMLAKIQSRAGELAEVLRGDEPFETIAEKYSSTSGAEMTVDVSETGFIAKGTLVPAVDEVLFALDKQQVSEPIETDNAFFVIKLIDIQQAREKSFAEVKDQVEKDLRRERAQRLYFELAEQLAALAFEHADTLEVAAEAVNITVEESDFFSQTGTEGLFSDPRVIKAAFSDDVLTNRNNSEPIELSDEQILVLRVVEHIDEGQKALAEVRDTVIENLTTQKTQQMVMKLGEELLNQLKSGTNSLAGVVEPHALEINEARGVKRDDISVNRSVLRAAFRISQPETDKPSYEGNVLGNGDYALVALAGVDYPEEIMGKEIDNLAKEMQKIRAVSEWEGYFSALKGNANIRIVKENL